MQHRPAEHSAPSRVRRRAAVATAFALVAALLTFGASLPAGAEVVGDGPGTISGIVTSSDGAPIEGALVYVSKSIGEGTSFSASTTTDAAGTFVLEGLPENLYYVSSSAPGFQYLDSHNVYISAETPSATTDFVLVPHAVGVGTISGRITADGVPTANVAVTATHTGTGENTFTVTDQNGVYEFSGLPNGAWTVYAFVSYDYQDLPVQWVELTDSSPVGAADFAFELWPTGTASIGGILTDAETGAPIASVQVGLNGLDVPHQSWTFTDETGAFSAGLLPEGSYYVTYSTYGYLNLTEELQVISGQTVSVNRALVPANAAINGHIKAQDGTPVAGIYVDAHTSDYNSFGGAVTDEDGNYVIADLGAVDYILTVGGTGTPYKPQDKTVTAVAHGSGKANFTLKNRTTGSLGGVIFAPGDEFYAERVCVQLYSSTKKKPIAEATTFDSNGDGSYLFDDVKPGSYTVRFQDCDDDPAKRFDDVFLGGVKNYADATFVTVVAAQDSRDNNLTFELVTASVTRAKR